MISLDQEQGYVLALSFLQVVYNNNLHTHLTARRQSMAWNKKLFFIILTVITGYSSSVAMGQTQYGVVLVAHGSNNPDLDCNSEVQSLYDKMMLAPPPVPLELAYLRFGNDKTLKNAVDRLQMHGTSNVLFIHLSPSSFSIRHRELEESIKPSAAGGKKPWLYKKEMVTHSLTTTNRYALSPAMDDNPLIIEILKNNANNLSGNPDHANESLLLVSYGAIEELENILWDRMMDRIGDKIKRDLGFKEVACISMRNHSADLIREQAFINLIRNAKRLKEQGRVLVVSYVLCEGAFQQSIQSSLDGIIPSQDISSRGVLSDLDSVAVWVREVIDRGMIQPPPKTVNRNWSAMDMQKNQASTGTHQYGLCEDVTR